MFPLDAKAGPSKKKVTPEARETPVVVDDVGTSPAREASPSPLHHHAGIAVLLDVIYTPTIERGAFHSLCDRADFAAESWLMATAAADHMTPWASDFKTYTPYENPTNTVVLADGKTRLKVLGIGTVRRHVNIQNGYTSIRMDDVLHVDGIDKRFVSVPRLSRHGFNVSFTNTGAKIWKLPIDFCSMGVRSDLWYWQMYPKNPDSVQLDVIDPLPIKIWHERMGHLDWAAINKARNLNSPLIGIKLDDSEPCDFCEGCVTGIWEPRTFKSSVRPRAKRPLEVIHSGIDGPMDSALIGGHRYFVVFVDEYTSHVWVTFMKSKSQTLKAFKTFSAMIQERTGRTIETFRSDRSAEFTSTEFSQFLRVSGISRKTSSRRNGFAEDMPHTLVDGAWAMLQHSGLPKCFWSEAVATAAYLHNRAPCKSLGWKTPYELLNGRTPDVSYLRVFGCRAWAHTPEDRQTEWDANSQPMVFVGYEPDSKAYRFWNPRTGSIVVSVSARFDESFFPRETIPPF
jgi:transposase InsO family protein